MSKYLRKLVACTLFVSLIWCSTMVFEKQNLTSELIRLQIVWNSDSEADQEIKQKVKDAVITGIRKDLAAISDISAAKAYVRENLPKIQTIVNQILQMNGYSQRSMVSFCKEAFDAKHYDTFSLPAGVYDCLRIVLLGGEKQIQSDTSGRPG